MSVGVKFEWSFPDWIGWYRNNQARINLFIAAQMQTNRGMLFDSEGAYNGREKWSRLKFRVGQILSMRGDLRKSIAPQNPNGKPGPGGIVRFGADTVTVGTDKLSAKLHNEGGVVVPKRAKALRIPLPAGKRATPLAKELRKGATSGKGTIARINELRHELAASQSPYRRQQLRGAIVRMENKFRGIKASDKFLFLKKVTIPSRRFDDWNDRDQADLETALTGLLSNILGGGK